MPSANINQQGEYFYYDPYVFGVSDAAMTVTDGTMTLSTDHLAFGKTLANFFQAFTKPAFVMGDFRVLLAIDEPNDTTASYEFGLVPAVNIDSGTPDSIYFQTDAGGKLNLNSYDKNGDVQTTIIDWEAAWSGAKTEFRIRYLANETVEFWINGIRRAVHSGNVPTQTPRHYFFSMNGADAEMDMFLMDFRSSKVMAVVPNEVTIGGTVTATITGDVTETNSADILTEIQNVANNISASGALSEVNPATTTSSVAMVSSTALEKGHVGKASAGYLFQVSGYNSSASDMFLQVFDSATEPAEGTAPKILAFAPSESQFGWAVERFATPFTNGIYVCLSSTAATKTVAGAVAWFNILRT